MINALTFFTLLMILHYSLTIFNINANALSLIFLLMPIPWYDLIENSKSKK